MRNRDEYIDYLRGVDQYQDWTSWIKFFLVALQTQALEAQTSVLKIASLYMELYRKVDLMSSAYARQLLDIIFIRPVVSYPFLKTKIAASPQTIYNLLDKFVAEGILTIIKSRRRNRPFIFRGLIDILK